MFNPSHSTHRGSSDCWGQTAGGLSCGENEASDQEESTDKQEPKVGTPLVPRSKATPSLIYSSPMKLKRKENPKSDQEAKPAGPVYKRPLPVELDPNLPSKLVKKFHNNNCELCDVKLNSRIQSKNHYEGKPHNKKVKNYLIEAARKDGQSAAKMPKIELSSSKKKPQTLDVNRLYCKCCDLSLTSEQHAQQHYSGKKHQKVFQGLKQLKTGYYNKDTDKWQKTPPNLKVASEGKGLNPDPPSDDETNEDSKMPDVPSPVKEKDCSMVNKQQC